MNINDLTYRLLNEMNLDIDANMNVYDQDNNTYININGKNLKATYNNIQPVLDLRTDILFEPLTNFKLMSSILNYFIQKTQIMEGRYFSVYYPINHPTGEISFGIVEGSNKIETQKYYNPCLACIDLIFLVSDNCSLDELKGLDSQQQFTKPIRR